MQLLNKKGLSPTILIGFIAVLVLGWYALTYTQATPNYKESATTDATKVTKEFYTNYISYNCNIFRDIKLNESGDSTNACKELYLSLTADVLSTVKQSPGYADPVLCAQDIPSSVTVDEATSIGAQATVLVHTYFGDTTGHQISVNLTQTENNWKITKITCPTK